MSLISDWYRRVSAWRTARPSGVVQSGEARPSQDDGSDSPAAISIPYDSLPTDMHLFGNPRSRLQMEIVEHPLPDYASTYVVRVFFDPRVTGSKQQPYGTGFQLTEVFPCELSAEAVALRIDELATTHPDPLLTYAQQLAMHNFATCIRNFAALDDRHAKSRQQIVSIVKAFFRYLHPQRVFGPPQVLPRGDS